MSTLADRFRLLWSDFKQRAFFFVRPTVHVCLGLQGAVKALPSRGGTIKVGDGVHAVNETVDLDRPVRVLGGHFKLGCSPAFMVRGPGTAHFRGCSFEGDSLTPVFVAAPAPPAVDLLQTYIDLEIAVGRLEMRGDPRADAVRDVMDGVWLSLRDDEQEWLNRRS